MAALRDVPAERRHNTATLGPGTVALENLQENIFFKYPVNKSRRPASKLYLFENVVNIWNLIILGLINPIYLRYFILLEGFGPLMRSSTN